MVPIADNWELYPAGQNSGKIQAALRKHLRANELPIHCDVQKTKKGVKIVYSHTKTKETITVTVPRTFTVTQIFNMQPGNWISALLQSDEIHEFAERLRKREEAEQLTANEESE